MNPHNFLVSFIYVNIKCHVGVYVHADIFYMFTGGDVGVTKDDNGATGES